MPNEQESPSGPRPGMLHKAPTVRAPPGASWLLAIPQSKEGSMATEDEYVRMRGTVVEVLRSATFKVRIEGGLEVVARPSGRMRRGRMIRILPGDEVDVEVSTYDPTKGRIVWRYR